MLITASADPVLPPPAPEIAAPAIAPVLTPVPPQVYVYTVNAAQPFPWLAVVLMGAGGFGIGAAGALSLIALHRRRAMRPRATEL